MLIVRDVFKAKPGMASKLAQMFREIWNQEKDFKVRVLTDAVGEYNTVVFETEMKDLAALDARMKMYAERTDMRQKMAGYTDLWTSGHREVLKVVD